MRDLFSLDFKDYNENGTVFSRPSVRAVIIRGDKVLMVHSEKYNYHKFPGGGIEAGETHEAALIREVQEEIGYVVKPETIREFGRVLRRQKDSYDENAIFEQENFYYLCEVEDEPIGTNRDDYEIEEGFAPEWVEPFITGKRNLYESSCDDRVMLKREAKVLDMVDHFIRQNNRKLSEEAFISSLGDLDYKGMIEFVKDTLGNVNTELGAAKSDINYSRFAHTMRVLGWAIKLYKMTEDKSKFRYEDVVIATIFHDVGRNASLASGEPHALAGVPITRDYLLNHGFEPERVEYICSLVANHSAKEQIWDKSLDPNLVLLMEADLLDDMGALGVVMDCMIVMQRNPDAIFEDCLDHITRFTKRIQHDCPMATPEGIALWNEKTNLVDNFVDALKKDIEL